MSLTIVVLIYNLRTTLIRLLKVLYLGPIFMLVINVVARMS